jgi:O-antigen/teichoic acid export membrane protein
VKISINGHAKKILSGLDWSLFKDSAVLTFGMVLARGVGLIVTMLQARLFDPADFGIIQYAISVAGIISIGLQPFGQHVLSRYVGMLSDKPAQLREYLSNIWGAMGIIFCISLVLAIPVLVYTGGFNLGVLAIFLGTAIYYAYYGLARGYLASGRLVVVDVGNNILQVILILCLIQLLDIRSTLLAMFIQGFACFIPIILLQYFWPLPNTFDRKLLNRNTAKGIFKFSLPIWISHASYMLYTTIAILFLEYFTDTTMVGIFSLATTLSIALAFFPNGLATFLMPKVAGAPDKRHKTLLANALGLTMLSSIVLIVVYYFFAPWLVERLFGRSYLIFPEIFVLMAGVTTLAGAHSVITSVYVGKGRAQEETKSRLVALVATFVGCWLLIPAHGIMGAVWANLLGVVCSLMVYGFVYTRDHLKSARTDQKI